MSTFASRRANQKKNKRKRIKKNCIKYLPKDGHGICNYRIKQMEGLHA